MDFIAERARLIEHLSREIRNKRVLEAMSRVPREFFIPRESRQFAYEDRPLPIGQEQTISQPFIIAMMTEALELTGTDKVLEIGTGSGYQTAILAELSQRVVSVERLPELAEQARRILKEMGYKNIEIYQAGDTLGWPQEAPYDAVMVTAAAPEVPGTLVGQLAIGGRMVIPVGSRYLQELYKVTRLKKKTTVQNLGGCRFVSLIGKGAWEDEVY